MTPERTVEPREAFFFDANSVRLQDAQYDETCWGPGPDGYGCTSGDVSPVGLCEDCREEIQSRPRVHADGGQFFGDVRQMLDELHVIDDDVGRLWEFSEAFHNAARQVTWAFMETAGEIVRHGDALQEALLERDGPTHPVARSRRARDRGLAQLDRRDRRRRVRDVRSFS